MVQDNTETTAAAAFQSPKEQALHVKAYEAVAWLGWLGKTALENKGSLRKTVMGGCLLLSMAAGIRGGVNQYHKIHQKYDPINEAAHVKAENQYKEEVTKFEDLAIANHLQPQLLDEKHVAYGELKDVAAVAVEDINTTLTAESGEHRFAHVTLDTSVEKIQAELIKEGEYMTTQDRVYQIGVMGSIWALGVFSVGLAISYALRKASNGLVSFEEKAQAARDAKVTTLQTA